MTAPHQDPYYILPFLMGVTMFFIQKMSSGHRDRPDAAERCHDLYAGHLCGDFFTGGRRSGAVLYRQQHGHHHSAAADLPWSGRRGRRIAAKKNPDSV